MNINKLRSILYTTARILGDVNAAKKGKLGKRIANKVIGRAVGKLFRK
jgi:hypothetical protein